MIGLLLGTAILIPSVAQAQERGRDRGDRGGGGERSFNWQRGGGQAARENSAGEAIASGRDAARDVERPAPAAQPQAAPAEARRDWNRGGNDNDRRRDAARGNDDNRRGDWNRDRGNGDGNQRWSTDRRDWNRDGRVDNRDDRRGDQRDARNGDRSWNGDRDRDRWTNRNDGRWDRDWRNDRRYSWQDYRTRNRQIYRLPRYSPPRWGHSYRRWSPGFRWDSWYYSSSYWIADPWQYRLPPAYGDYRWVRYYDDAVLVDIRTGEIADIIYSFFF